MKTLRNPNGYITLMSVIFLGAIAVAVAGALILLGLADSQTNFAGRQSAQANALAGACAESALDSLRADAAYAGNETLTLGAGSCEILPVAINGLAYTIQTKGTVGSVVRKTLIEAQRQNGPPAKMQITSWQEVADF